MGLQLSVATFATLHLCQATQHAGWGGKRAQLSIIRTNMQLSNNSITNVSKRNFFRSSYLNGSVLQLQSEKVTVQVHLRNRRIITGKQHKFILYKNLTLLLNWTEILCLLFFRPHIVAKEFCRSNTHAGTYVKQSFIQRERRIYWENAESPTPSCYSAQGEREEEKNMRTDWERWRQAVGCDYMHTHVRRARSQPCI